MTQARKPRIALEPNALQALKIWAALVYEDPSALAGKIILDHMPSEVKGLITPMPSEDKGRGTSSAIENEAKESGKSIKRIGAVAHHGGKQPLSDGMKEKILGMWADGKGGKSQRTIAKELGLNQSTVSKYLKKPKDGEENIVHEP
jgi:DNA invertase Pin-like site-specific DNA recombinase